MAKILKTGKITGIPLPTANQPGDVYKVLAGDSVSDLQRQMNELSKKGWAPAVGSVSFRFGKPNSPNKLRLYIVMSLLKGGM